MEHKEEMKLVLWLTDQKRVAEIMAERRHQPEQSLFYARAKAFGDVIMHIEKPCPEEAKDKALQGVGEPLNKHKVE